MSRCTRAGVALAVVSVVGTAVLSGCGTSDSSRPDGPVIIVSGQSSQNGDLLKSVFDKYNAKVGHEAVALRLNADSDVDTAQKALVDLAAGHGPDAVRVTNATYQTMIDAGAAQPADECLAPAEGGLDRRVVDGIRVKGSVYEIPWYVTPNALFYNADLFTAAGLDPDRPPKTMAEFHAAARAVAGTGAAGGTAYFGNDYNFQTYVASLGGSVYDPATGKLGIDTSQGRAAFDVFGAMAADGSSPVYPNFFQQANEAFAGGKLGMIVTAVSGYPALKAGGKVKIRIAPVPAMDGGKQVAATSTNGFVITTKDPARRKAVCDALRSLLTPETVTATVRATATIPLLTSVAADPEHLAPVYAENPDWAAVRDQETVSWQSLPGGANAEYTKAYVDTQLRVLRKESDGSTAAAKLQSTAEQLRKEH